MGISMSWRGDCELPPPHHRPAPHIRSKEKEKEKAKISAEVLVEVRKVEREENMNCPHCSEELDEVYVEDVSYANYTVTELNGVTVGIWHESEDAEQSRGPYCRQCGGKVDIGVIG